MDNKDYRSEEGKERSRIAAAKHMAKVMADPEKRRQNIEAMQAGRRKTFAELKRLKEERKTVQEKTAALP